MAVYPSGFVFSSPPALLGPRAGHQGSAFAPYSPGQHYGGGEPRTNSAISNFLSPGFDSSALDFHAFAPLGPCLPYVDPAFRKNATRDATATLKAWLSEHRKNPYPTKGEKIMLAIVTKMSLTQVSTWFANARRRLKKENKMSWTPRNRSEDEDEETDAERGEGDPPVSSAPWFPSDPLSSEASPHCSPHPQPSSLSTTTTSTPPPPIPPTSPPPAPADTPKPKLWSLAEMATSQDRSRGPILQGPSLSRPVYIAPAYIYQHYNHLHPNLSLNGAYTRDFGLRTLDKGSSQLLVPP
ncbi:unnamed protein product [Knipowitschia caucasica]|uniref:Homeobox domain-containing protein n=1 Tax=Knipowitschia caucasica TaxID=637954 RepID=A0AAV2KXB1_KNICA